MVSSDQFLKKLQNYSGYLHYQSPQQLTDDANEVNAFHGRAWQIRIAILPEAANLQRGAEILAPILIAAQVEFKCLVLNNSEQSVSWDGTAACLDTDSDRDQRGKEVCIYLRYDNTRKTYEKNVSEWKNLLLQCWQTLYNAKVTMGYVPAGAGDKAIEFKGGLTPFSYSAFKPYGETHGILRQPNHNPLGYPDPLRNLHFDYTDLEKAGIPSNYLQTMQRQRIRYLQQHLEEANKRLLTFIKTLQTAQLSAIEDVIKQLATATLAEPIDYTQFDRCLTELLNRYPRKPQSSLLLNEKLQEVVQLNKDFKRGKVEQTALQQSVVRLQQFSLADSLAKIVQDITQDLLTMKWWQEHSLTKDNLVGLVNKNPAALQLLYRQLLHLGREAHALTQEQNRSLQIPKKQGPSLFLTFKDWFIPLRSQTSTIAEPSDAESADVDHQPG